MLVNLPNSLALALMSLDRRMDEGPSQK